MVSECSSSEDEGDAEIIIHPKSDKKPSVNDDRYPVWGGSDPPSL